MRITPVRRGMPLPRPKRTAAACTERCPFGTMGGSVRVTSHEPILRSSLPPTRQHELAKQRLSPFRHHRRLGQATKRSQDHRGCKRTGSAEPCGRRGVCDACRALPRALSPPAVGLDHVSIVRVALFVLHWIALFVFCSERCLVLSCRLVRVLFRIAAHRSTGSESPMLWMRPRLAGLRLCCNIPSVPSGRT